MSFLLISRGKPLSYWFFNSNGEVKDFIRFSNKNFMIFPNLEEVISKKDSMLRDLETRKEELDLNLYIKLEMIIRKMKILEVLQ